MGNTLQDLLLFTIIYLFPKTSQTGSICMYVPIWLCSIVRHRKLNHENDSSKVDPKAWLYLKNMLDPLIIRFNLSRMTTITSGNFRKYNRKNTQTYFLISTKVQILAYFFTLPANLLNISKNPKMP